MRSITEIIKPIKLLSGSHPDVGVTGQGCFMNVIAYLNGEAQITDQSECVCVTIRPIAIWLNDNLPDQDRHKLVPYLLRAKGSATEDRDVIIGRLALIVEFARACAKHAAKSAAEYAAKYAKYAAEYAAKNAAKYAAKYAKNAAKYAAKYAAEYAAKYAKYAAKNAAITDLGLKLMDDICPKLETHNPEIYKRAEKIVSLQDTAQFKHNKVTL